MALNEKSTADEIWAHVQQHRGRLLGALLPVGNSRVDYENLKDRLVVSDAVHDKLPEKAAQALLRTRFGVVKPQHSSETDMIMELMPYIAEHYEVFERVPLVHKVSNVSSSGTPLYPTYSSVIDVILSEMGISQKNIAISTDCGYSSLPLDLTYFKDHNALILYTAAQEQDPAGKPSPDSKNAHEWGFDAPDINVEFIWTDEDQASDPLLFPVDVTGTKFKAELWWAPGPDVGAVNNGDVRGLKSLVKFTEIMASGAVGDVYYSNSDWSSKSSKDMKAYASFNMGLSQIRNGRMATSATVRAALTVDTFDQFRALAKGFGDRGTATLHTVINMLKFKGLIDKADRTRGATVEQSLSVDTIMAYRTLDRLAACMALIMPCTVSNEDDGCPIVFLEHPTSSDVDGLVTIFIKKSAININLMADIYFGLYGGIISGPDELDPFLRKFVIDGEGDDEGDGDIVGLIKGLLPSSAMEEENEASPPQVLPPPPPQVQGSPQVPLITVSEQRLNGLITSLQLPLIHLTPVIAGTVPENLDGFCANLDLYMTAVSIKQIGGSLNKDLGISQNSLSEATKNLGELFWPTIDNYHKVKDVNLPIGGESDQDKIKKDILDKNYVNCIRKLRSLVSAYEVTKNSIKKLGEDKRVFDRHLTTWHLNYNATRYFKSKSPLFSQVGSLNIFSTLSTQFRTITRCPRMTELMKPILSCLKTNEAEESYGLALTKDGDLTKMGLPSLLRKILLSVTPDEQGVIIAYYTSLLNLITTSIQNERLGHMYKTRLILIKQTLKYALVHAKDRSTNDVIYRLGILDNIRLMAKIALKEDDDIGKRSDKLLKKIEADRLAAIGQFKGLLPTIRGIIRGGNNGGSRRTRKKIGGRISKRISGGALSDDQKIAMSKIVGFLLYYLMYLQEEIRNITSNPNNNILYQRICALKKNLSKINGKRSRDEDATDSVCTDQPRAENDEVKDTVDYTDYSRHWRKYIGGVSEMYYNTKTGLYYNKDRKGYYMYKYSRDGDGNPVDDVKLMFEDEYGNPMFKYEHGDPIFEDEATIGGVIQNTPIDGILNLKIPITFKIQRGRNRDDELNEYIGEYGYIENDVLSFEYYKEEEEYGSEDYEDEDGNSDDSDRQRDDDDDYGDDDDDGDDDDEEDNGSEEKYLIPNNNVLLLFQIEVHKGMQRGIEFDPIGELMCFRFLFLSAFILNNTTNPPLSPHQNDDASATMIEPDENDDVIINALYCDQSTGNTEMWRSLCTIFESVFPSSPTDRNVSRLPNLPSLIADGIDDDVEIVDVRETDDDILSHAEFISKLLKNTDEIQVDPPSEFASAPPPLPPFSLKSSRTGSSKKGPPPFSIKSLGTGSSTIVEPDPDDPGARSIKKHRESDVYSDDYGVSMHNMFNGPIAMEEGHGGAKKKTRKRRRTKKKRNKTTRNSSTSPPM
jgi:hypothetical protein